MVLDLVTVVGLVMAVAMVVAMGLVMVVVQYIEHHKSLFHNQL